MPLPFGPEHMTLSFNHRVVLNRSHVDRVYKYANEQGYNFGDHESPLVVIHRLILCEGTDILDELCQDPAEGWQVIS